MDDIHAIEQLNLEAQQVAPDVGHITAVEPKSAAAKMGVLPGDDLLAVNGHACMDVIDVQYHAAEDWLELKIRRDGAEMILTGARDEGQALGLEFAHPTFDIDIRRCNNLCPFCFVLQMGPRFRRTLYIKDDDYRYSFLFGHYVTLTNLSDSDWRRILDQRLSPLYVSVHATDLEKRRECLRNPTAPDVMNQLRQLADRHFEVHTQIVVTPGMNDGDFLAQSVHELADLYPTVASISIVPVGLTKFHKYGHSAATIEQAKSVLTAVEGWQREFLDRFGLRLVYCTDEYYLVTGRDVPPLDAYDDLDLHENGLGMVRHFLDEWQTVKRDELPGFASGVRDVTLVTGSLAGPVIERAANELAQAANLTLNVIPVINQKLGDTITVAGLLMGEDVLNALKTTALGELVILPRIMFDHPDGVSLDDISPAHIAKEIGRPVALADLMGDVVDALIGQNKLTFAPDAPLIKPHDIALDGGWSVEKYL